MAGIQSDGSFERKHINEIQESLLTVAESKFGDNVDLSPGSPHRQLIDVATIEIADLWETLEGTYYASYFPDAVGVQIDRILALAGVSRLPRRGATGEVTFSTPTANDADVTIPAGTRVSTPSTETSPPIPFKTTQAVTLPAGQTSVTQVPIRALEPWETDIDKEYLGAETNVSTGTIRNIDDPIAGVEDVTNPLPTGTTGTRADGSTYDFVRGRNRESDHELKARYRDSLGLGGQASLMAIRSNVYNVDGVIAAAIEENTKMTDNTATGGLPPKSFRVTVVGGADNAIAQAITETRSAGIQSYGAVAGTSTLSDSSTYTEHFDRATDVPIYVDVALQVDSTFPSDGAEQVQNNIIRYIGGTDNTGAEFSGTDIGVDVMYDLVFSAAMNVDGVYGATVYVDTVTPPAGQSDVAISPTQVARTALSNITVSYVVGSVP